MRDSRHAERSSGVVLAVHRTAAAKKDTVPDLLQLRASVAIAQCNSIRQGAILLGIRQSVASRRLQALEVSLGVPLFVRHSRGIRPTPAGAVFVAEVARVLSLLDQAVLAAQATRLA